jgi:hypothetical protein
LLRHRQLPDEQSAQEAQYRELQTKWVCWHCFTKIIVKFAVLTQLCIADRSLNVLGTCLVRRASHNFSISLRKSQRIG